jgi:hypothetical protein
VCLTEHTVLGELGELGGHLVGDSMKRFVVLTVLVVAGALSIAVVRAQQNPAAIQLEKVKDGLYIVTGSSIRSNR